MKLLLGNSGFYFLLMLAFGCIVLPDPGSTFSLYLAGIFFGMAVMNAVSRFSRAGRPDDH